MIQRMKHNSVRKIGRALCAAMLLCALFVGGGASPARASIFCLPCLGCCQQQSLCGKNCADTSGYQTCSGFCGDSQKCVDGSTIMYITDEFLIHREWLMKIVWESHMLPAMMLMTEQLTTAAMYQVEAIGMILDAKHQLETQAIFQDLHAQAHKDYQVSEGVCQFGTNTKSLAAATRNTEFSQTVLNERMMQRILLSGDVLTSAPGADRASRLEQFLKVYCNPNDNNDGLRNLCNAGGADKTRMNRDIDYTNTVDRAYSLKLDFTPDGDGDHTDRGASPDEEDIFALAANLYANETPFKISESFMAEPDGTPKDTGSFGYMSLRSLIAKRSVAQNSFAAIAAMRAQSGEEVKPYMQALLKEIGIPDEDIETMLGDKPSYYAQMDVLTKKIYQDPVFYADLYDKPANVMRKNVAMRAINNIQKRDIYRSLLRSEQIMSVWLETEIEQDQMPISNELLRLNQEGTLIDLPQ
jgi:hypothetical protein